MGLLAFTLVASLAAVGIRSLVVLRRVAHDGLAPPADLWRRSIRATRRTTVLAIAVSALAWVGCGALAWTGTTAGLRGVTSLAQLVGAYHLSPDPVGPPVTGYTGAVIGDSRAARLGGPPVPPTGPSARPDDAVCKRSTDSLAAEIGDLLPARVLNLACPDATVTAGLRGPQDIGGQQVPAQVGVLRQVQGLRFVVLEIGPNDVGWTDFLRYCYGVPDCADALTQNEFDYRLAAFDRAYGDLLVDLNDLPGRPQVIVVTLLRRVRGPTRTAPTPRRRATPAWTPRRSSCSRRATTSSTPCSPRAPRSTASRWPARRCRCCATRTPTGWAPTSRA